MRVACLMMQKNEDSLLLPWIEYYSHMFGPENLYVYDNGSSSSNCLSILRNAERRGVNVDFTHDTKLSFEAKGDIIAEKIISLDKIGGYDMYFPLDCDEFIGVDLGEMKYSFQKDRILEEISIYRGAQRAMLVRRGLDNHPTKSGWFRRTDSVRKTFFPARMCKSLDVGYHDGQTRTGKQPKSTRLVYLHYHWKPYNVAVAHTKEKLSARLPNFDRDTLIEFRQLKKPGHHLIDLLLKESEEEYTAWFDQQGDKYIPVQEFEAELKRIGLELPYASI